MNAKHADTTRTTLINQRLIYFSWIINEGIFRLKSKLTKEKIINAKCRKLYDFQITFWEFCRFDFALSLSESGIESLQCPISASKWLKNFLDSICLVESQHVIENQYYISFFRLERFAFFCCAWTWRFLLKSSTTISKRVKSICNKKLILKLSIFWRICLKLTMSEWIYTINSKNHSIKNIL